MDWAWGDGSGIVQWSENTPVPENKGPDLALSPHTCAKCLLVLEE